MNNQRRKAIAAALSTFEALNLNDVANILADVEALRDEEQEYFDNMPEGLQGGDKGSMAEEAIGQLEEAIERLQEIVDAVDTVVDALNNAQM